MSKVVTINIPASWVPAIKRLIGKNSIFSSRSELIRNAVKTSLKTHISDAKLFIPPPPPVDPIETEREEKEKVHDLVKKSMEKAQQNHKLQLL